MAMTLYSIEKSSNTCIILITAEYCRVQLKIVPNNQFPDRSTFYLLRPFGDTPLLQTNDGSISGTEAIIAYLVKLNSDNNTLLGSSPTNQAYNNQWIDYAYLRIDSHLSRLYLITVGLLPRTSISTSTSTVGHIPMTRSAATIRLAISLKFLNSHLADNKYMVGDSVTLADIVITCYLWFGFTLVLDKRFTSTFPHIERYFWHMITLPKFRKILGDTVAQIKVKPAPLTQPKQEGESLNKATWDELKKFFYNYCDAKIRSIEEFWEMYDPAQYSFWFCDYKYNDKNTVSFEAWNKICGLTINIDRNYAFGKMLVIGSEAPFKMKGLWLSSGQQIPQNSRGPVNEDSIYKWTKVDLSDVAQKASVNHMIEGIQLEGEPVLYTKQYC